MHEVFARAVEALVPLLHQLSMCPPVARGQLPKGMPKQGVYLFSEGGQHLYVGRSNNLRRRYGLHCRRSAAENLAVFAFKLARQATGRLTASYRPGKDSRKGLMEDPVFAAAFVAAKARIREMEFRFVEEGDPTRQALLEIYCSIALSTPFNDFDTH